MRARIMRAASAAARIATLGVTAAAVTWVHFDRIHCRKLSSTAFRLSVHPANR